MKLAADQTITLRGYQYRISERVGSGAVVDVYRTILIPNDSRSPSDHVIIKLVRDDVALDETRLAGVRREAEVLEVLNRAEDPEWPPPSAGPVVRLQRARELAASRRVVALLDSGEIEGQPYLIQEQAPPAFDRVTVNTLADEQRILEVARAVAGVMTLAHQHDLALKDFEPRTKWDRIRVRWDAQQRPVELKIIDWNITGGREDIMQDLFYLGGHLYYFLLGDHVALDKDERPPANLELSAAGWSQITEGSRQILHRLLHRDPRRRYQRADEVMRDLAWWIETLAALNQSDSQGRLQERLWQAQSDKRFDRVLAVADFARHLDLPQAARENVQQLAKQAREELEKEDWLLLAQARVTLQMGSYTKAAEGFRRLLRDQNLPPEAVRKARLYEKLSLTGDLLKRATSDSDIRGSDTWGAVTRAVEALSHQQWQDAQAAIKEAGRLQPGLESWAPIVELQALAEAGVRVQEANRLIEESQQRRADVTRSDWLQIEREKMRRLEEAVDRLYQAAQTQEPDIQEYYQAARERHELRQRLLTRYEDINRLEQEATAAWQQGRTAEDSGRFQVAVEAYERAARTFAFAQDEVQAILDMDSAQFRATVLRDQLHAQHDDVQKRLQSATGRARLARKIDEWLSRAEETLQQRNYDQALEYAAQIEDLASGRSDTQLVRERAIKGLLALGRSALDESKYERVLEIFQQVEAVAPGRSDTQLLGERVRTEAQKILHAARETLRTGDYSSAVRDAERAALVIKDSDEVREVLQKATAGAAVVVEAEKRLAEAAEYLRRERIPEAKQLILEVSQWHERPIGTLPATTAISMSVGSHLFYLSSDLQQRLQALLQHSTQLASQRLERVLRSPDPLRALEDLGNDLVALDTDLDEQAAFHNRAGETWIKLVKQLDLQDFDQVSRKIVEGIKLFKGTEYGPTLDRMLEVVKQTLAVTDKIEPLIVRGNGAPRLAWNGEPALLRNALTHIIRESSSLIQGDEVKNWPRLAEAIRHRYQGMMTSFGSYIAQHLDMAIHQIRSRQYDAALRIVQNAWDSVPVSLQSQAAASLGIDRLALVLKGLQGRRELVERVGLLAAQVGANAISLTAMAEQLRDLPQKLPGDVPLDDIHDFVATLQQAARIEQVIRARPEDDEFVAHIDRLWASERELDAIQIAMKAALSRASDGDAAVQVYKRIPILQRELRRTRYQTAEDLCWKLCLETLSLIAPTDPEFDRHFLSLFWQACWWKVALDEAGEDNELEASPEESRRYFEQALQDLATRLEALASQTTKASEPRSELYHGLLDQPQSIRLPALPSGKSLPSRVTVLSGESLSNLGRLLAIEVRARADLYTTQIIEFGDDAPLLGHLPSRAGPSESLPTEADTPIKMLPLEGTSVANPASVRSDGPQSDTLLEDLFQNATGGEESGPIPPPGDSEADRFVIPTPIDRLLKKGWDVIGGLISLIRADKRHLAIALLLAIVVILVFINMFLQNSVRAYQPGVSSLQATITQATLRFESNRRANAMLASTVAAQAATINALVDQATAAAGSVSPITIEKSAISVSTSVVTLIDTPPVSPAVTPTVLPSATPRATPPRGKLRNDAVAVYSDPETRQDSDIVTKLPINTELLLCTKEGTRYQVAQNDCSQPLGWVTEARIELVPVSSNPSPTTSKRGY